MTRTLDYENWWGDDGTVLVVFGHVDRHELAAAAEDYGRSEWGLWPDDFAIDALPQHQYAVLTMNQYDEPWLYYQQQPQHPAGFDVYPITIACADGSAYVPDIADVPVDPPVSEDIAEHVDPLADRLITRTVHA